MYKYTRMRFFVDSTKDLYNLNKNLRKLSQLCEKQFSTYFFSIVEDLDKSLNELELAPSYVKLYIAFSNSSEKVDIIKQLIIDGCKGEILDGN